MAPTVITTSWYLSVLEKQKVVLYLSCLLFNLWKSRQHFYWGRAEGGFFSWLVFVENFSFESLIKEKEKKGWVCCGNPESCADRKLHEGFSSWPLGMCWIGWDRWWKQCKVYDPYCTPAGACAARRNVQQPQCQGCPGRAGEPFWLPLLFPSLPPTAFHILNWLKQRK